MSNFQLSGASGERGRLEEDSNGAFRLQVACIDECQMTPEEIDCYISVTASKYETPVRRHPKVHVFIHDVSGSMFGKPIEDGREITHEYLDDDVEEGDYFALIVFNTTAQVVLDFVQVDGDNLDKIKKAINGTDADGGTHMDTAFELFFEKIAAFSETFVDSATDVQHRGSLSMNDAVSGKAPFATPEIVFLHVCSDGETLHKNETSDLVARLLNHINSQTVFEKIEIVFHAVSANEEAYFFFQELATSCGGRVYIGNQPSEGQKQHFDDMVGNVKDPVSLLTKLTLRIPDDLKGKSVSFGPGIQFPNDFQIQKKEEFCYVFQMPTLQRDTTREFVIPIMFNDTCSSPEPGFSFLDVKLEVLNRPKNAFFEWKDTCQVWANTDRVKEPKTKKQPKKLRARKALQATGKALGNLAKTIRPRRKSSFPSQGAPNAKEEMHKLIDDLHDDTEITAENEVKACVRLIEAAEARIENDKIDPKDVATFLEKIANAIDNGLIGKELREILEPRTPDADKETITTIERAQAAQPKTAALKRVSVRMTEKKAPVGKGLLVMVKRMRDNGVDLETAVKKIISRKQLQEKVLEHLRSKQQEEGEEYLKKGAQETPAEV